MPWLWDMIYYCMDLYTGQMRHFPAGTYHAQVADQWGKVELDMMEIVFQAWRTFKTKAADWGDFERRVAARIMDKVPPPTHRLDDQIMVLWPVSIWSHMQVKSKNG